jgi:hypothetical protein
MSRSPPGTELKSFNRRFEQPRFWQALGHFVADFAHAEALTQLLLWKVAGLEMPLAQAVLSGVRVDQAMGLINRAMDALGRGDDKLALERYFNQFGLLNRVRNDILHYGPVLSEKDVATVSNALAAHLPSRVRETKLSISDLEQMSFDLRVIGYVLAQISLLDVPIPEACSLLRSWRYKQPPQAAPPSTSRKTPTKR